MVNPEGISRVPGNPHPVPAVVMADALCTIMIMCRGKDRKGTPFWAYMCIKPSMAGAFRDARAKGALNLADYGNVMEMGEGAEPPPDIVLRMQRDFGFNPDFEAQLLKAAEG